MSTLMQNIFENEEALPIHKIILSLLGIVFIRVFLENFSSPDPSGLFFSWKDSYLQFPIYYASVFLSFFLLLHFFTKKTSSRILNFEIRIFLFALIAPIADLLVTSGEGSPISYIFTEPQNFPSVFLKLMNPLGFSGVTFGVHMAAYTILLSMCIFTYKATKNIFKSFFVVIAAYALLFVYAITPSIIALPHFFQNDISSVSYSYASTLSESWIIKTQQDLSSSFSIINTLNINASKNQPITQLFFIYLVFQSITILIVSKHNFWSSIKKNMRLERIFYWYAIASIGMVLGLKIFRDLNLFNAMNLISLTVFLALIALNTWLAICINDPEDIKIDTVSNPDRPLAKKTVSIHEWRNFQLAILILLMLGVGTMNPAVTFLLILSQLAYYIYSARPLRLKKHFLSSSLLIGIASIATAMAGFFLVSPDQHINAFPIKAIWIIGLAYALISNLKDIKDFEGDRIENIRTMPVVFGLENSKKIIAFLHAIVLLGVPLLLDIKEMIVPAVFISLFLYFLFTKKEYQEKYIFLTLFLYLITLFLFTR